MMYIIQRRGRPFAALISIDDLRKLEALESEAETRKATRVQALAAAAAVREQILAERHGVLLPDAAEIITRLSEERFDELVGVR